jgi:membrane associated rhomboid family serine protease
MLPLRDVHKPKRVPFITRVLLVLNLAMFAWQCWPLLQGNGSTLIAEMGVRPHCYIQPGACGIEPLRESAQLWQPLLLAMFLHGGVWHLAFNLLFLWVFGPGVEDKLGRVKYLAFYLCCGVLATLAHVITHPMSDVPVIGASGAIAGVLGAYLILLPRSWILTYLPPIFLFPVPAPLFLILWFVGQVVNGLWALPLGIVQRDGSDVAWMAHLGGFAAGVIWAWRYKPWWKAKAQATRSARATS